MKPFHFALAVLVAAIWGGGFVAIHIGLESFPPIFFTALRSTVASLPFIIFFPRPGVAWKWLIAMGFSLGVLLTGLLNVGMNLGMPAGLSSLVLQAQAFFTVLLAAALLSERPTARQIVGMAIAFSGIGLIAMTRETGGGLLALGLVVAAAFFWGVFNILIKQVRAPNMPRLIIWINIVPPLPLLALSWVLEGPARIAYSLTNWSWSGVWALLYLAVLATVVATSLWGFLFRHYPASQVAPFSLLVPVFGMSSAALVFGESLSGLEVAGSVLVAAGLVIINLKKRQAVEEGA
jgi:O-acetylserine/cysteine efflux transporter